MNKENDNSSMEVCWKVRDARGLSQNEKAFLFVVASRGVMTAKWDTASADMGMGKDMYYRTRDSLIKKELLVVGRRHDKTTVYKVDVANLSKLVPAPAVSHSANDFSQGENDLSHSANDFSHQPETKVTMKVTEKETIKAKTKTDAPVVADAPTVTFNVSSNSKVEEEVTSSSSNSSLKDDSPVSLNSLKNKSRELAKEQLQKAAARHNAKQSDEDQGRDWLETLIKRDRTIDADRARELYNDSEWRPATKGTARAASATMNATLVMAAAVKNETTTNVEAW